MRLGRVRVDSFRGLRDVELDLDAGLVVVEGPNEAGKSTLLAFVQALLFPSALPAAQSVEGSLDLTVDAQRYRIERRGARAKHRLIDLATGAQLDLARLAALTGNLEVNVYRNVFAFGLGELQAFDALNSDAVKERLYSAAVAGAGESAGNASRQLDERVAELLLPRKASTVLAKLAAELNSLRSAVAAAREESGRFAGLAAEREAAAAAAAASARELKEAGRRKAWLADLLNVWPAWHDRSAALGDLGLLAAAEARLEAEDDGPAAAAWLRHASGVRGLAARLEAHEQTKREVSTRSEELQRHLDEMTAGLRALGPGWGAKRVAAFAEGAAWRSHAAAVADDLRASQEAIARLEGAQAATERRLEDAGGKAAAAREAAARLLAAAAAQLPAGTVSPGDDLAALLPAWVGETQERQASLRHLEELTAELATARDERAGALERLQAALDARRAGWWRRRLGWPVVLVLAGGAAWLAWDAQPAYAYAAIALGAAGAALLWPWRRRGGGSEPLAQLQAMADDLRDQVDTLTERVRDAAADLGLDPGSVRTADLRAEERHLLARAQAVAAAQAGVREAAAAEAERGAAQAALTAAAGDTARLRAERATSLDGWRAWCAEAGMPADASPADVAGFVAKLEGMQAAQAAFRDVEAKLRPALERKEAFEAEVGRVAALLGVAPVPDAAATVEGWVRALAAAERRAAELDAERARLEAKVAGAERDLERTFGASAEAAAAELSAAAPQAWQEGLAAATAEERRLEEATRSGNERAGALGQRLADLAASTDLAINLQELARVGAEAQAQARRWLVARLARSLIHETLREYESTKVPEVMRRAGDHLGGMTAGRYVRAHFAPGDGLRVFTPDDDPLPAEKLSRGTQEQLYLAVRLGLIESFSEANVALPLVLDDVLVNADPVRAERLADALARVAERQQLLFLTCHPHFARLMLKHAPGARHILLGGALGAAGGARPAHGAQAGG